ncbi:MAG: hypothetical protein WBN81_14975 [Gammaproteobacteria bacterium]
MTTDSDLLVFTQSGPEQDIPGITGKVSNAADMVIRNDAINRHTVRQYDLIVLPVMQLN